MLYNPTAKPCTVRIKLPLYYSGLTSIAHISEQGGPAKLYKLNRDYSADVMVTIPANGYKWLTIK